MNFCVISEKGLRENNEDYFIAEKINDFFVFAIADGMGGHAGGEIASKIAIVELKEALKRKSSQGLKEGFEKANSTIFSENERRHSNMGTTLVAFIVKEEAGEYIVANVGDSRAYIFGDRTWKTNDHSWVEDLVKKGAITEDEAIGHPQKNIITRALGLEKNVKVDLYNEIKAVSVVLLCSDGLSDYVTDKEIAEVLEKNKPKMACKKLIKKALENGSKDNITIIIVNFKD
jgi:protein phosphatase